MIKNKILRKILPGIRAKLSFFTAILVISILAFTSAVHYSQQKKALEEKLNSELKAPLEYVNTVVLDLENLSRSMILIEEFKIRVKEKKKELSKFKRTVVQKEAGFLGALKSFGQSIGLNVKRGNVYRSVDTYFTRYLSEKEIKEFETNVRNELRKETGAPIDAPVYDKIRSVAEKTALARLSAENARSRIDEIEDEIKNIEVELLKPDLDPKKKKTFSSDKEKLEKERKTAERSIPDSEKKAAAGETSLAKALQNFFRGSYKDGISSLGLLPDKIRILAYDRVGKQTLDTGLLFLQSSGTAKKLLSLPEFEQSRASLFGETDVLETIRNKSEPEAYEVGGRQYEVVFRPVFRNPNTAERSRALAEEVANRASQWREYLEEDRKLSSEFAELAQKLKTRITELRKDGKAKPAADSEFRTLTANYRKLLKKRETKLEELQPYVTTFQKAQKRWREEKKSLEEKAAATSKEILEWEKKLKLPLKQGDIKESPEEIQENVRQLEAQAEEVRDSLIRLESSKDDWSLAEDHRSEDAFYGLREAALDDFTFLPFKAGSAAIRRYYKDPEERKNVRAKWKLLREWILAGSSETELPNASRNKASVADSGILIRSRSEAEEVMWALDSSPLVASKESAGKGVVYDLLRKNLLGYNLILIDRTEGARQIRDNRDELIRYTAIIGAIAILLAYGLAWFVVRRIRIISRKAEEIGEGNLKVEFPPAGYDEIGILSESLNDMVHGLEEREEMRGELLAGEEIQKRLLPEKLPTSLNDFVEFGAFYKAMAGVGGDYYDFIELGQNKIAFCIGDVSNHGVGPAIVMALFRAQIRSILRRGERDLKKILLEMNSQLYDDTPDHIFVTFFLGFFDSTSSKVEYISAGHVKPLFYDASEKKLHELPAGGLPIGMDENSFFETTIERRVLTLDSGDIFFEYTDGLDEARNPEGSMYGRERLAKLLFTNGEKRPAELIKVVVGDLEVHTKQELGKPGISQLSDDIAMIAVRKR
ncbi:SpoIIE-like protein phosphatase domain protein [Leptospira inadai serovar Lyme str. 10]|uniref:SpoIIE-like protein phosphatase domain protein n=2 Tax=Leptospira inadai serovar Lyme TaxID=293084 RepID=V6H9I3_9LEPT|nr:SpoIIE family protein phosphatase [Leptospira inadai]EQA35647.1 SpoIIE-like protein phosphatase domain protein [Leptospira inadai serovar Lyme str. 10]PNV72456.1 guanylate cyclase [Leptospira inadai serovar Lyme]